MQNRLVADKGEEGEGGMDWEFGISRYKLLHREQINNKSLYSTRKYIQYPINIINHNRKEYEKEYIYMYN